MVMAAKLTRLTHKTDITAPSGRELYHLQSSLQAASPEAFGYTSYFRYLPNLSQEAGSRHRILT